MHGNHPLFRTVRPGERVAADYLNDITNALQRAGRFGDRVNGLTTTAGIYRRPEDSGLKLRTFELDDRLTRTTSTSAKRMAWNGEEWMEQGETAMLYGDFFRGCGLAGDRVQASYSPSSARWYAVGSGHTLLRGKLDTELESGGSATLNIWEWDEVEDLWSESDPLKQALIWEAIGLETPIEVGAVVLASWHEQAQVWIATNAACPAV
jgi:hypothetical protein